MALDHIDRGIQALQKLGLLGDDTDSAGNAQPQEMNAYDKFTVVRHCLLDARGDFISALMEAKKHPSAALADYFYRRTLAISRLENSLSPEKEALLDEIRANPYLFRPVWYATRSQQQGVLPPAPATNSQPPEEPLQARREAVSRLLEGACAILKDCLVTERSKEHPSEDIVEYLQERIEADTGLLAAMAKDMTLFDTILSNPHLFDQPEKGA